MTFTLQQLILSSYESGVLPSVLAELLIQLGVSATEITLTDSIELNRYILNVANFILPAVTR